MHENRRSHPSLDPHGYQPLIINEHCLSDQDRRQALLDAMAKPRDWLSFLTPEEREELVKASVESTETREKRFAASRLGMYRAFARDQYNHGHRVWFGDAAPFR